MPFVAIYEFILGCLDRRAQRQEYEQRNAHELANATSRESLPKTQRHLSRVARFVPKYFRLPGPEVEAPKPHLGWLKSLFRAWFPEDSPRSRKFGYAMLLISSFCITVGNWMATVSLLQMAGETFCPSNIWALVLTKLSLSIGRILTDFIHVP
jgi:hypothetical protein